MPCHGVGGEQFTVANMNGYYDPRWAAGIFGIDFNQTPYQIARNQGLRAPRSSVMVGARLYTVNVGSGLQIIRLSR